ncbi:efflux RND transporter permease subunit [Ensifer sp. YR511]|uniref:efflux RND transporter permease subunit n=1 Tax=Ensifer sp. YR511 TaxID=1855294 RepID=UPI00088C5713|nr:efflux RND transporter permease subunit [Ensifer sp. YR511]SDN36072.1 Multidrug efflux pump subunit AcrB [Ensifer sp. YR511]
MNVSAWAVKNPVAVVLLFSFLCAFGLFSFSRLAVQSFPDLDLPVISIDVQLEGASPQQLETEMARKLEDRVATLNGVSHIRTTITDGSVSISVEFDININPQIALEEVRNAVEAVRADLPPNIQDPVIARSTVQSTALLTLAVSSDDLDEMELSWFVDNEMAKALRSVRGIGTITRIGGLEREVLVELDPARLAALQLTASEVADRIGAMQVNAPGGKLETRDAQQSIRVVSQINQLDQLSNLTIPLNGMGAARLGEIAKVTDASADRSSLAFQDGRSVIAVQIKRLNGFSDVRVAEGARSIVANLAAKHADVSIVEASSTLAPTLDEYGVSMQMLYEGIAIAVVIVWLSLRDVRATIISAIAMPLSILPTFIVMDYLGFSLNAISLLALSLVVGILVDDAIVEVENIDRHLEAGTDAATATIHATQEIGLAVTATTFTLVAVFLPTAFMGDVPGIVFRQFGLTASAAVLTSLVVARLLTPMLAARLMKPKMRGTLSDGRWMRTYLRLVRICIFHSRKTIFAAIAVVVGSISLVPLLDSAFVPAADVGQTSVQITLQPGSTLHKTAEVANRAQQIISQTPEVTSVLALVGSSIDGQGPDAAMRLDPSGAVLTVDLLPIADRTRSQTQIENEIRSALDKLPGARVLVGAEGDGKKLDIVLTSENQHSLSSVARNLEQQIRGLRNIGAVTSSASLEVPEVQIRPLPYATQIGVTATQIARVARIASYGDYAAAQSKLDLEERQLPIRVRLDKRSLSDQSLLSTLRISAATGSVSLGSISDIRLSSGPAKITRIDRERNITISVELNDQTVSSVMAQVQLLSAMQNIPNDVRLVHEGELERMESMFDGFVFAILVGIAFIYAVLALLFHDFLQPVTILSPVPLAIVGGLVPLVVTGTSFSMATAIGALMLIGIVTKNSILLVEFASTRKRDGLNRTEALLDACHKRARPILMTTVAMIGGMVPIVLGLSGGDASFRQPMGLVVIGGLITSTVLSLVVVPAVYVVIDEMKEATIRLLGRIIPMQSTNKPTTAA